MKACRRFNVKKNVSLHRESSLINNIVKNNTINKYQ